MARSSSVAGRAQAAKQSFKNAAECIGDCVKDMSLFAVTRGQWSMIDAVLHVLDCVGKSKVGRLKVEQLWKAAIKQIDGSL